MASFTSALLGTGLGVYQAIDGAKRKKDAMRELNEYDRQKLDNAYEDVSLSLEGNDLLRDENARASAGIIDAASNAGSRAIIGAAPRVSAAVNNLNTAAARNLDDQINRREYAIAGDNARIEGITENRDNANIAALSSEANAGRQDMFSGMLGAASGLGYAARNYTPGINPEVESVTPYNFNPSGLATIPVPEMPITATPPPTLPPAAGSSYWPSKEALPFFDFKNSFSVPKSVPGPSSYNPFAGFPNYFNTYS